MAINSKSPNAILRITRPVRVPQRGRYVVHMIQDGRREAVHYNESLRDAISFALDHMGAGDTLDVKVTLGGKR